MSCTTIINSVSDVKHQRRAKRHNLKTPTRDMEQGTTSHARHKHDDNHTSSIAQKTNHSDVNLIEDLRANVLVAQTLPGKPFVAHTVHRKSRQLAHLQRGVQV
eukprot:m.36558 g.36558  ORF g.36558 m.36558 type:complete len:103 (-) comp11032_c0_seq2:77-385(-)